MQTINVTINNTSYTIKTEEKEFLKVIKKHTLLVDDCRECEDCEPINKKECYKCVTKYYKANIPKQGADNSISLENFENEVFGDIYFVEIDDKPKLFVKATKDFLISLLNKHKLSVPITRAFLTNTKILNKKEFEEKLLKFIEFPEKKVFKVTIKDHSYFVDTDVHDINTRLYSACMGCDTRDVDCIKCLSAKLEVIDSSEFIGGSDFEEQVLEDEVI